ncbi:MAG: outer membrane assembly lipoprotein YfiO [Planctomycetota bacterium]|jgi:outer membrane assembly lipoprotein YfiO
MPQAQLKCRIGLHILIVLGATLVLGGCGSFGREFNQSLPDFLRSDPGADELERYQARIRVLNRSDEESAQAKASFDTAKAFYEEGDHGNAAPALALFLEDYPDTVDDRMARHLLIKSYIEREDATDARIAITEFVRLYPISELNAGIEESAWILGNQYLEGDHNWFIFDQESDGVSLLRLIVLNFPNGHHADEAQWKLGNYLYDKDNFLEAEAAYATIVERYNRSIWAPRAQYNQGLCRLAMCKGPAYDQENMYDGIWIFERFIADYPEDERREEALKHISFFKETLAKKLVSIANWYVGQDHPSAGRFYLRKCLRDWPTTETAKEAQELLAELPKNTEDQFFEELENEREQDAKNQPMKVNDPKKPAEPAKDTKTTGNGS